MKPAPEEERRLLYVALTRAKRHLFLSAAHTRTLFGKSLRLGLSSLVRRLPAEYLTISRIATQVRRAERRARML